MEAVVDFKRDVYRLALQELERYLHRDLRYLRQRARRLCDRRGAAGELVLKP
jgi:putative (di)nucleoside polyphosphate hydrolase